MLKKGTLGGCLLSRVFLQTNNRTAGFRTSGVDRGRRGSFRGGLGLWLHLKSIISLSLSFLQTRACNTTAAGHVAIHSPSALK